MKEARRISPEPPPPGPAPSSLRQSGLVESIFHDAGVGMVVLDAQGTILEANRAMESFLGVLQNGWRGRTLFSYAHPEEMKDYALSFQSYQNGGYDKFSLDGKYLREGSHTTWGRLTVTVLRRANAPDGFLAVGLMENITQKRQAQARLAESEEKFRSLVSNLPGIIYRCGNPNRHFALEYISEGVQQITGFSAQDFLRPARRTFASIVHPDDRLLVERAVAEGIHQRASFEMKYRLLRSDGTIAWVCERGCGSYGRSGKLHWIDGFIMDISAEVQSLQKIEEQQVRMLAASKLSALGQMSAGIAHEVNNPLAIIHGAASILRMEGESDAMDKEAVQRAAELIQNTAMRISRIVKALRTFSREGHGDPLRPTNMASLIAETMEFCRERFKSHSIELRVNPGPPNLSFLGRSVQISQVLVNLLNNSFDAVESEGERWIDLRAEDKNEFVEISVADSGPGIPKPLREKILLPFFTTKEVGRGTGLGLSISAGIVESHQGSLTLDENSPHTRFVVRLPKNMASAPPV